MVERDLAEDAEWKRIQQNTFTRWANEHLKFANSHIDDLESDLSDGLKLVLLCEVLAQKRLPKHNKKPTYRTQKLENVSVALKFLENQGIRLVNIGKFVCTLPRPLVAAVSPPRIRTFEIAGVIGEFCACLCCSFFFFSFPEHQLFGSRHALQFNFEFADSIPSGPQKECFKLYLEILPFEDT